MNVSYGVFGNLTETIRMFCECGNSLLQSKGFFFVLLIHFAIWLFILICTEISRANVSFFITKDDGSYFDDKSTYRKILYLTPVPLFFLTKYLFGDSWVFITPLLFALIMRVELFVRVQQSHAHYRELKRRMALTKVRFLERMKKALDELKGLGIDLSHIVDVSTVSAHCGGECKGSYYVEWILRKLEQFENNEYEKERLIRRLAELSSQATDYESFDKGFDLIYDCYNFQYSGCGNGGYGTHWHELPPEEKKSSFWDEWDEMCQRERQRQEDYNKQMDDIAYSVAMNKAREQGIDTTFNSPYSAY